MKNKKPLTIVKGFVVPPVTITIILLLIINELGFVSGSQCEPIEKLKELLDYLLKP